MIYPHPIEDELVMRMSNTEAEADQISLAETASCGTSSLEDEETRPCNACPNCDDVCESPDCLSCVGKKRALTDGATSRPIGGGGSSPVYTGPQHHAWGQPLNTRYYTPCQVRRHVHADSCWLVAGDTIYDATPFLKTHPGGSTCILRSAGGRKDCTKDIGLHSKRAQQMWKSNIVGKVRPCGCCNQTQQNNQASTDARPWWMLWQ
jgi:cytochrome b involved in lipid metabolism